MAEPRTPSTPQSLAQLRDQILRDHHIEGEAGHPPYCAACGQAWTCDAVQAATLLSVENVAAGLVPFTRAVLHDDIDKWRRETAAALLGAIPVGGETPAPKRKRIDWSNVVVDEGDEAP